MRLSKNIEKGERKAKNETKSNSNNYISLFRIERFIFC